MGLMFFKRNMKVSVKFARQVRIIGLEENWLPEVGDLTSLSMSS